MTVRELLERLAREGLVDPAKLDAEAANAALQPYQREHLRVQQAGSSASVWFGAFFLAFFLIVNDITKHPPAAVTFGAIALVAAAAISREAVTLLRLQLVWIAVIFGQALIVAALADVSDSVTTTALTVLALEAVTIAAVRNLTVACAAVVAAVVALLALIDDLDLARHGYDLMALSLGTGTCLLWVHEAQLGARLGRLWQPLAYTLPVAGDDQGAARGEGLAVGQLVDDRVGEVHVVALHQGARVDGAQAQEHGLAAGDHGLLLRDEPGGDR